MQQPLPLSTRPVSAGGSNRSTGNLNNLTNGTARDANVFGSCHFAFKASAAFAFARPAAAGVGRVSLYGRPVIFLTCFQF